MAQDRFGKRRSGNRPKGESKTLEELEVEMTKRSSDMYHPATLKEQITGTILFLFKGLALLAVAYLIYSAIPAIFLFFGVSLNNFFNFDNVFIYVSFLVIVIYILYMGSLVKK